MSDNPESPWNKYKDDCERVRQRLRDLGVTGGDVWELADNAAELLERLARLGAHMQRSGLLPAPLLHNDGLGATLGALEKGLAFTPETEVGSNP